MKKTTRQASRVEYRPGSSLEFLLDRPPYCAECRDRIASIQKVDPLAEIEILRSAGYSDPEIHDLYSACREAARSSRFGSATVDLLKPVKLTFSVGERRGFFC